MQCRALGFQVTDHGHFIASRIEMTSQTVSKHFVRQDGLVDATKPMALEKRAGAGQGVNSWEAELSRLVKTRLEQTRADVTTAQILTHHERPHLREIGEVDMKCDASTHSLLVHIGMVVADVFVKFRKRTWKQSSGGDLVVDKRFQGGHFRDPRLTDGANVC